MSAVAERPPAERPVVAGPAGPVRIYRAAALRWPWIAAVALLCLGAFLLRVWGVEHGLPYAYNADENSHFVPRAIGLFGHGWNPDYFVNPPAYTYVLHIVFALWFGGREAVSETFATNPTEIWIVGRVVAAALGTVAVWLLYLAGARLLDRRVGLLAAGLLAVAFLPVFYSHLALNDVPTLAPVALALYGAAGALRFGRRRDFAIAGIGLGLACATKYTGGIVVVAILAAAASQWRAPGGRPYAVRGLGIAGAASLLAFVAANPYVVLDFGAFWDGITHQSTAVGEARGKLGLTHDNGLTYYLWSFTWGLGWVPLIAAIAAVPLLWRDEPRLVWFLALGPVLYVLFMGTQERYFGRWLIPVLPFVCLLAAYAALEVADRAGRWRPALRPTFIALAVVALCGQGVVYSLHIGQVLSREDTRNLAREWLVDNVPRGAKIVVEPVVPDAWAQDIGDPNPRTSTGNRWIKFPSSRSRVDPRNPDGPLLPPPGMVVNIEDYERVLRPERVDQYVSGGWCWVIVGSTQRGRAEVEPEQARGALAYYRELERRSRLVYRASPYARGEGPVEFNFDWSFDFYPLAYHRPGPVMSVYRLTGGRCAQGAR